MPPYYGSGSLSAVYYELLWTDYSVDQILQIKPIEALVHLHSCQHAKIFKTITPSAWAPLMPKPSENIPFPLYLLELLLRQNHINSFWLNIRPSASLESSCSQRRNPGGHIARLWSILRCRDDFSHPDICDLAFWRKKNELIWSKDRICPRNKSPAITWHFLRVRALKLSIFSLISFTLFDFISRIIRFHFSALSHFFSQLTFASFFKDKHFSSLL